MEIKYSKGFITPEEVIKFLVLTDQALPVYYEIIKRKEAVRKAIEMGIMVPDEDLQQMSDSFRAMKGLYSAKETLTFLDNFGLTHEDFEEFCEAMALMNLLKDHLATEQKIQDFFVNNRSEFDHARISVNILRSESLAKEIITQVTEDGEDFHRLARKYSEDQDTKYAGGYVGVVTRGMLTPEVSAKVFNASEGGVIGPFRIGEFFQLILVEEVVKCTLDETLREEIKERIFMEWVSQYFQDGIEVKG